MGLMLNRRRVCGGSKSLPYDYEVEYLELSTDEIVIGRGLITIPYIVTNNCAIESKFNILNWRNSAGWDSVVYQAYTSETSACYRILRCATTNSVRFCFGQKASGGYQKDNYNIGLNQIHTVFQSRYQLIIDGINITYIVTNVFNSENTEAFGLCGRIHMTLYYLKLFENGDLIYDLIPVVKDGLGYMYDKISNRLFGKDLEGEIIPGPRV